MSGIDSMVEFYVHENMQLLEQLEEILLGGLNEEGKLGQDQIEEIFRAMHTIKGSSAMMGYESLTQLTHSIEDVFDEIRNGLNLAYEKWEELIDLVLEIIDFLKSEILNVQDGLLPEGSIDNLHDRAINLLKNSNDHKEEIVNLDIEINEYSESVTLIDVEKEFYINIKFEKDCGMEGIRALGVVMGIENLCNSMRTIPEDLNVECDDIIIKDGFKLYIKTKEHRQAIEENIQGTMFLDSFEIEELIEEQESELIEEVAIDIEDNNSDIITESINVEVEEEINIINEALKTEVISQVQTSQPHTQTANKNNYLTVNINKIDMLMNLVGEIVTTESMVEKQSQLENFDRDLFEKQARRLHQLTTELQDVVMSIRMVPISSTFTKMQRVVRDMSKKTGKIVELKLIGEQTEVDKTILENISDPLMHMIRNSMDHGIEMPEERKSNFKNEKATITLEAKNTGGDVVIIIKDDGRGLNKEAIIKKAIERGITSKNIDDISDKEAYNFILSPGFSTKEAVTEYSGRGVGMDVVHTNIKKLRGSITIDSEKGKGTMIVLRIPLTLAIVDGMKVKVGNETYIIPSLNIKEVFRSGSYEIVRNPNGEEHSIIRGNCYEIRRLSEILEIENNPIDEGIMILVESEMGSVCMIVDKIIGQQHVVIKPIPHILTQFEKVQAHMSGCSILEDGSISLIFDVNAIIGR